MYVGVADPKCSQVMSRKRLFTRPDLPRFLAVTTGGVILVISICLFGPVTAQIACIGILVVLVLSLILVRELRPDFSEQFHLLDTPMALARDRDIFELYRMMATSLKTTSLNHDPVYRDLALERIRGFAKALDDLSEGRIIFTGTETWRMAYARLLQSPGLHLYRSIAYVKTSTYWQDEPGRQSMQLNFELTDKGTPNIERIAILPDHLWPAGERFPVEPLHHWIDEQQKRGISLRLVRQSTLAGESDLLVDLGIYGTRAVGFQELDDQGRTVRFTLSFDFPELLAAEQRWERLSVYSTAYRDLLSGSSRPG